MEHGGETTEQANNEGEDIIQTLMMLQQQEEMFGEMDLHCQTLDNAEIMHLLAAPDAENIQNKTDINTKKKYQRHTAYQIQQLEAVFKECPQPDERQRIELSERLGLNLKQIKFWFQNKRTQIKAQTEHNTNILLKEENDKLRHENAALKAALTHPLCRNCRGSLLLASPKGKSLTVENTHLKEYYSASASAAARSHPAINIGFPSVQKHFPVHAAERVSSSNQSRTVEAGFGYNVNVTDNLLPAGSHGNNNMTGGTMVHNESHGSPFIELVSKAMEQLLRMTEQSNVSLWINTGESEVLNVEEYLRTFPSLLNVVPGNFVHEASRETGIVMSPSQALVDILMDSERWMKMFPSLISAAFTIQVIFSGIDGTKNGTVQLMDAELQVLTPMVPLCKMKFVRYCKQFGVGKWAVVDVSADTFSGFHNQSPYLPFRLFPSGCVIQELPNGCSNVTWVAHNEYDETAVAPLYRSMLRAGLGFGSVVWLERLKRQCQCISSFAQSALSQQALQQSVPVMDNRGLLYVAQRMSDCFCYGVCGSKFQWVTIQNGAVANNYVFIKSRVSLDQPGEPTGIVLSATTSFWLPVNRDVLFHYLKDINLRNQWDSLSQDTCFFTILNVKKCPDDNNDDNSISIFRPNTVTPDNMVILQDTWSDDSASLVVYAPLQISDIQAILEGGDSASISLLPSGFSIYSDCQVIQPSGFMSNHNANDQSHLPAIIGNNFVQTDGSLLTVGFQVLVSSNHLKVVEEENIHFLNTLVVQTCNRIRQGMDCA